MENLAFSLLCMAIAIFFFLIPFLAESILEMKKIKNIKSRSLSERLSFL